MPQVADYSVAPWEHENPFKPGTLIRADAANVKLDGIAANLKKLSEALQSGIVRLPESFTGNSQVPEKTLNNSFIWVNDQGNIDALPYQLVGRIFTGGQRTIIGPLAEDYLFSYQVTDVRNYIFDSEEQLQFQIGVGANENIPGTVVYITQRGDAQVTITNLHGVLLESATGFYTTKGKHSTAQLIYQGRDRWVLSGEITGSDSITLPDIEHLIGQNNEQIDVALKTLHDSLVELDGFVEQAIGSIDEALDYIADQLSDNGGSIVSLNEITAEHAQSINALTFSTEQADARIIDLQEVSNAFAQQVSNLNVSLGDAQSSITALQQVTGDQATQVSQLSFTLAGVESTVSSMQIANSELAQQVTSVQTKAGENENAVNSLQQTTANQATALESLSSRASNAESQINTLQEVTADQATSTTSLRSVTYSVAADVHGLRGDNIQLAADQIDALADYGLYVLGQKGVELSFAQAINTLKTETGPKGALAQNLLHLEAQMGTLEDSAKASALDFLNARVGYCLVNGEPSGAETPEACSISGGEWVSAPLAEVLRSVRVQIPGGGSATVSQLAQAFQNKDGQLVARGAMLTDNEGRLSGFINTNTGETSQLDMIAALTRIGDVDAQGNFVPLLALNTEEGVLDIKARLVLRDGHVVEELNDIRAKDGEDGDDGLPGPVGAGWYQGVLSGGGDNPGQFRMTDALVEAAGRQPVSGDILFATLSNGNTRVYTYGSSWIEAALTVHGSIVALGSISGDRIQAGTEISAPILKGGMLILAPSDSNFMELAGVDFGDQNQFIRWYGPRNGTTWNSNTNFPRLDNLTYANAIYFRDKHGQYTQDVRRSVASGSGTSVSVQHLSQGSLNTISGRVIFSGAMTYVETGQPLPSPTSGTASITIDIRRGTTVLATVTRTTTWQWNFAGAGGEERTLSVSGVADIDADDTRLAGNVTYSVTRGSVSGLPRPITITYNSRIATLEIRE